MFIRVRFFEFYDFYTPDISNKAKVVALINEAIELIKTDNTLEKKAKDKIIKRLQAIISELQNQKTNWKDVFGKVRETIIILGALGSLAGGTAVLSQASQKIKQAEVVIEETSINNNYFIEQKTTQIFLNQQTDYYMKNILPQLQSPKKENTINTDIKKDQDQP